MFPLDNDVVGITMGHGLMFNINDRPVSISNGVA